MTHFRFYLEHSLRDLTRNGRRTAFALFCVAAGVAAIVSLRTLALSIGDTLVNNIAGTQHGDMTILPRGSSEFRTTVSDGRTSVFTDSAVSLIAQWAEAHNVQMTGTIEDATLQVAAQNGSTAGRPQFLTTKLIDPAVYPFYSTVTALDPAGVPLAKLFTGGNDVVISKNLADNQHIAVGDQVHVSRTTTLFTVRGILPTDAEGFSPITLFFGFAYFDRASTATFQLSPNVDTLYFKIPPGANVDDLASNLRETVGNVGRIDTTTRTLKNNQQIANLLDRLVVTMGLVALLIGGTGIIHTMLVIVRRRTVEIAVLKTLGVKGGQITMLFLVESVIMGILGSIFGVLLGILFSGVVLSFSQRIWVQTLHWQLYPQAMLTGLEFGIVVTTVFGFLPTLTAATVRPATVLRPNEALPPASGCFRTLLALAVVVVGVGLIVGQLLPFGGVVLGIIGVAVAMIVLGMMIGLMWLIVLIIGKLPPFGSVDLRLALRGIGSHRLRTASTLLALTTGMFALSTITLVSTSIPALLNIGLKNALGGNVLTVLPIPLLRPLVTNTLDHQTGVTHYLPIALYTGQLVAVNENRSYADKLPSSSSAQVFSGFGPGGASSISSGSLTESAQGLVSGQDVAAKGYVGGVALTGRTLNAEDAGKRVVVVRDGAFVQQLGIKPGDQLTYSWSNHEATYTVVGILQADTSGAAVDVGAILGVASIPMDALPAGVSTPINFIVSQVDPAHLNEVLVALSAIPGTVTIDVGFIDSLIKKLLDVFTTIPTIVAVLSLFAGAVIIANTVSLSTLERRREIGIMKALGLKNWRTLGIMILENGLIGLLGGVIGIGIGVVATIIISNVSGVSITQSVAWGSVFVLLALSLAIALVATLLSAWSAVSEKPLNVLRYE